MNRLTPIEGLRAYLAIWVIIGHVMGFSGIDFQYFPPTSKWNGIAAFFRHGNDAVYIFMMISGFVIFFLLDKKKETYPQFIIRRFFRLYPLYILLLTAGILTTGIRWWTIQHSQLYFSQLETDYDIQGMTETWQHLTWNVLLHLGMIQGIVPDTWLGSTAAFAFLGPAWSISLEWQFYLLSPLVYMMATAERSLYRVILSAIVFLLYISISFGLWPHCNAFILFFIPYFFVGVVSYFIYKIFHSAPPDTAFPMAFGLDLVIFFLGGRQPDLVPLLFWILFLGLLCEPAESISSRFSLGIFNNRITQYLGAISYGLYLSHELIITVMQYLLITLTPEHGKIAHFWILLFLTLSCTILLSSILHRAVEIPGIELGRKLAARLN